MYRYGDGTPFPLDENFIETITSAVEACTNAFMPLTELDGRRERARAGRAEADRELGRLTELEKSLTAALAPYMVPDRKSPQTQTVAQATMNSAKDAIRAARIQVEGRVAALEAQAAAGTANDAVLHALRPFFDHHQLPNTKWVMSWDVRHEPRAEARATAGRLTMTYSLQLDTHRNAIRVGDLAEGVIVHMMKKGLLGKAKPAPVDLSRYVMVAFERTETEHTVTLKEKQDRASLGLRFLITTSGHASWQSVGASGEPETEPNPLDFEDIDGVRRLGEGASRALKDLVTHRTLSDIQLGNQSMSALAEPRVVPMEVLQQLTPLSRTIRERSRVSGELVLKRDVGGGRREELFVPRAQLAQQFAKLPMEYRKPFEDMGVSSEDTQPAIALPQQLRPPAAAKTPPPAPPNAPTIRAEIGDADRTNVDKKPPG